MKILRISKFKKDKQIYINNLSVNKKFKISSKNQLRKI